jgi:predicted alpha/beta superfamily hydrolase
MLVIALALATVLTQQPAPVAPAPAGAVVISIESKALGERRDVWVDAPAGCAAPAACDTLYVLDGHALFPVATAYASVMHSMGRLRPIIIVGIPSLSMDDRIRNFTTSASEAERKRYPNAGGASAFAAFLRQEVAPAIGARFKPGPGRYLAGHSLAGLFAVDALTRGDFDGAIAISPTLGWHDGAIVPGVERWLKGISGPRRIYVSVSDGDTDVYRSQFARLEGIVQSAAAGRLQATFLKRAGEDHVTTFAPALQQAILSFFPK